MKHYLLYDGERFVSELSFTDSLKESGLSKPTFMRKIKENCGIFQKNNYFIVKNTSKAEMMYMLELTRFFIKGSYNPDRLLHDVENFYKKISLTL